MSYAYLRKVQQLNIKTIQDQAVRNYSKSGKSWKSSRNDIHIPLNNAEFGAVLKIVRSVMKTWERKICMIFLPRIQLRSKTSRKPKLSKTSPRPVRLIHIFSMHHYSRRVFGVSARFWNIMSEYVVEKESSLRPRMSRLHESKIRRVLITLLINKT